MADFSNLTAARDKLNADIGALVAAGTVPQATVDSLTAELTKTDTDVVAAGTPPPPPPPPPPPTVDFSKFALAATNFEADTNLTQAQVDAATAALVAATV